MSTGAAEKLTPEQRQPQPLAGRCYAFDPAKGVSRDLNTGTAHAHE